VNDSLRDSIPGLGWSVYISTAQLLIVVVFSKVFKLVKMCIFQPRSIVADVKSSFDDMSVVVPERPIPQTGRLHTSTASGRQPCPLSSECNQID
jgi:hypothetical protein